MGIDPPGFGPSCAKRDTVDINEVAAPAGLGTRATMEPLDALSDAACIAAALLNDRLRSSDRERKLDKDDVRPERKDGQRSFALGKKAHAPTG